jgi:hypothetical protein
MLPLVTGGYFLGELPVFDLTVVPSGAVLRRNREVQLLGPPFR